MATSVYDFKIKSTDGKETSLAELKGQVLLFVNVASKCGLTPQYRGLQSLHERYFEKGLRVLAFPANNFGAQEPGTNAEIQEFCSTQYDVSFPVFSKISVAGPDISPLYQYLTTKAAFHSPVSWNFQKFLVDRNGHVVANINPKTTPDEIAPQIESLLG